jgi:bifunctional oligoribonuclease and PAP phosphatase NrnA
MQNSLAEIAGIFQSRNRFVVISHARPDGDALGCTIATALCLQELGKDVTPWNEDGVPGKYRYLPKSEIVSRPPAEPQRFEVAVILDNAVKNRVGQAVEAVVQADTWINIDHHITNDGYGDVNYIDATAPATGQILFELFHGQKLPLTAAMADNLFVAISTDTGSFQYPSTTARTYEIAAELIRAGVQVGALSQKMYESYPRRRLELLCALLNVLRFTSNDRVASFALSAETVKKLGVQPDDTEGLIDYIRAIDGVVAAAFFDEIGDGRVRVSLRSKTPKINVSKVCGLFGGGGHTLAAGARIPGSLAEVQEKVLQAIDHEFDQP